MDSDYSRTHKGIPHVSLERALIDSSIRLTDNELSYATDQLLQRKLMTIKNLEDALTQLKAAPGREMKRIRKLFLQYNKSDDVFVESVFEKRAEKLLNKISPYRIVKQFKLFTGGRYFRADFAIIELKIIIEIDGFEYHSHRHAFDNDRLRSSLLTIDGWRILHITATMSDQMIRELFLKMIGK